RTPSPCSADGSANRLLGFRENAAACLGGGAIDELELAAGVALLRRQGDADRRAALSVRQQHRDAVDFLELYRLAAGRPIIDDKIAVKAFRAAAADRGEHVIAAARQLQAHRQS